VHEALFRRGAPQRATPSFLPTQSLSKAEKLSCRGQHSKAERIGLSLQAVLQTASPNTHLPLLALELVLVEVRVALQIQANGQHHGHQHQQSPRRTHPQVEPQSPSPSQRRHHRATPFHLPR
jgi:hypothetical protein